MPRTLRMISGRLGIRSGRAKALFLLVVSLFYLFLSSYPTVRDLSEVYQIPCERIRNSDSYSLFFSSREELLSEQKVEHSPVKKILYWTRDNENGRTYGVGLGDDGFRKAGCPVWQCAVYDREMQHNISVDEFDAVVFHDTFWHDKKNRPAKRSPHQAYVLWTREVPGTIRKNNKYHLAKNFINWTMTHRWDSDIVIPYGWIAPLTKGLTDSSRSAINHAAGKTKLVAWFASNCKDQSGRLDYVTQLQRFVPVDVYGHCGTLSCPRTERDVCRSLLQRDYKFYLSFENSLCMDYVTEKFFVQLQLNVVPIVFDVHGNHARFAPPHSYINALDFPSVQDLANYLKLLDQNDELYNSYFSWKEHYVVHDDQDDDFKRGFCHLCTLLHRPESEQPRKVYPDLKDWLYDRAECKILRFMNDSKATWMTQPLESIIS